MDNIVNFPPKRGRKPSPENAAKLAAIEAEYRADPSLSKRSLARKYGFSAAYVIRHLQQIEPQQNADTERPSPAPEQEVLPPDPTDLTQESAEELAAQAEHWNRVIDQAGEMFREGCFRLGHVLNAARNRPEVKDEGGWYAWLAARGIDQRKALRVMDCAEHEAEIRAAGAFTQRGMELLAKQRKKGGTKDDKLDTDPEPESDPPAEATVSEPPLAAPTAEHRRKPSKSYPYSVGFSPDFTPCDYWFKRERDAHGYARDHRPRVDCALMKFWPVSSWL